jgi:hypothetical protein
MAIDLGPDGLTLGSTTINNWDDVGGGKVLQVVQSVKTDTSSLGAPNWVDVSGLSVNITPSSTSSKILVMASVQISHSSRAGSIGLRLNRSGTAIGLPAAAGSRPLFGSGSIDGAGSEWFIVNNHMQYLDSPSTTSTRTYKVQAYSAYAGNMYINRSNADRNTSQYDARTSSTIIVMEIAG